MSDNRTTELREKLTERGVEWTKPKSAAEFIQTTFLCNGWGIEVLERSIGLCVTATNVFDTPEQAIAATLGSDVKPCYATDYTHGRCKYSVKRGWTEDTKFYVPTLRHGTLTAEQVREAIEANSWAETSTIREFNDSSWQAIADELNVELGSGTCEQVLTDCDDGLMPPFTAHCSACGAEWGFTPRYCHNCGARVVGTRDERKAVER